MNANNIFIILLLSGLFFIPTIVLGQKSKFPKDTIYLMYKDTTFSNPKMKSKSNYIFKGKEGIKFWWKGKWLFYNKNHSTDTLCLLHFKNYKTLNPREVREKEIDWVNRKFKNQKYKPYSGGSKNAVFVTYLIEILAKEEKFIIYPVIWGSG